jgi:uncharacterized repeat protein (TIGR01451 family)
MKNNLPISLGRTQSPRLNFRAFASIICTYAILIMPFAQVAAATRLRSELTQRSSKVKEGASTNRAAKYSVIGSMPAPMQSGSPVISATLTDNRPTPDPAVANPGNTIQYTSVISNTGTADATGVQFNDTVDANTTVVTSSVRMSPLAFADNYNGVPSTQLVVAPAQGVLVNDKGLPAPTAVPISGSTTQGGTVNLAADGSFTYDPPANFANGSDTFTYTATNGQAPNDTATVTITIPCQTINVTNPANTAGTAGSAFSETFTQTGALGTATFTTASTLPTGLSLAANGALSGTPTQTGSFPIVVTVTDGNGCTGTSATYNLTIACQTITVTNPTNGNGTAGSPFSETFTQTGAIGSATFTLASGTLPAGLTLAANGVLSGTPTQTGSFPITVTVTDANGCTGTGLTYTVVIGCQTITVTNPANSSGTVSSPFSETFTQSGAIGGATFTTASTLPAGLTLATNGVLSGTPTQTGSFPIVVAVTDANGCTGTGATYNLTISCQTITVTNPANASGTAGSPFGETFTQTGAVGGATFTTASTLPAGLTLASNGVLSGTPTQGGSFPIVVTVTDANGCTGTGATYTLVISCQTITVTNPANASGAAGSPFSESFIQTGAIGTATFTTASTLPAGLTLATNGVLSGTPTQSGSFPIVVTVTDSNGCTGTGATYNLTISCQTITVTNPANASGTAGSAFSETFTQTGAIGTATFTLASGTLPAGLALATNGTLSGTPTQTGSFPITVTVTDSNGCTGTGATYTLVIGCQTITVNNPAEANGSAGSPFSEMFTQTGAIGSATFTLASGSLPAGITLATNGTLSGTPTQTGSFPITVTVTDSNGCTGTSSTYTLVIGCQTITVDNPANGNGTVGSAFSKTFTQTGAIGTATFTTASTLPNGLSLSTAGVLSGTPSQAGTFPIVVTVTDSNGCTGTSPTYNLTIDKGDQTISFTSTAPSDATVGGPTYTVTATATSGLTVTFAIDQSASAVCSIAGSTVSFDGVGTCVINANQAGDDNYNAAPQVQQSFAVSTPPSEARVNKAGQNQAQHSETDRRIAPHSVSRSRNEKEIVKKEESGVQRLNHARSRKLTTRNSKSVSLIPIAACTTTTSQVCVDVGTLPAGKSVTITFSVTINTPYAGGSTISNQATVSGSNFSDVVTDDPDTGAANDATLTPICGANLVVTNTSNSGNGSLRQTILNLCPGGTITFDPALTSGGPATITLLSELVIDKNMTINGPTNNGMTLSGGTATRIFNVNNGVSLSINSLTIANGKAATGGGILNAGTLTISNSTITNNTTDNGADATGTTNGGNGGDGGGFYNTGTLTLINSTVGGNRTGRGGDNLSGTTGNGGNSGKGAAIYNTGTVTTTNTTITDNQSGRVGLVASTDPAPPGVVGAAGSGGIHNGGGTLTLRNTIVSNNRDGFGTEDDINGAVNSSSSFNFIGSNAGMTGISHGSNGNQIGTFDNPLSALLAALADNGGPTRTYLPGSGSPVIDAGSNALAKDQSNNDLTTDQRGTGFPRIVNGTVEIGSVESTDTPAGPGTDLTVTKTADSAQVLADRDITYTITVRNILSDPASNASLVDTLPQVTTSSGFTSLTFVSLTAAPGWSCITPSVGSGGTISCTRASVAGSSVHTFTLVAHVPASAVPNPDFEFISNTATVTSDNDPNTENDSGTASTLLVSCINNPVVTTNADSGAGSLRQAIADACAGSTITFNMAPGQVTSPITLTTGALVIDKNLTIQGPSASTLTIIRSTAGATPTFQIFRNAAGVTASISGLTLTNGVGTSGSGSNGGGILNEGTLTIRNSVVAGNSAVSGGGIYNLGGTLSVVSTTISNNHADSGSGGGILSTGTLTVINSSVIGNAAGSSGGIEIGGGTADITNTTISGNSATGDGGGLQVFSGSATLTNVTVTNNRSDSDNSGGGDGGGIRNGGGTIRLRNTIVAGNYKGSANSTPSDIAETVDVPSSSFNLIGTGGAGGLGNTNGNQVGVVNPQLGSLANNGGPTDTHLLLPLSPAINAGSNALLPATDPFDLDGDSVTAETLPVDQRGPGFARIVNTTVDIGAVEVNYVVTATAGTPQSTNVNTAFTTALKVNVTESGVAQSGVAVTFNAPVSGASGTFPGPSPTAVVLTNSSGDATAPTFTANAIGGTYNVLAAIGPGVPTATFVLTNNKLNQTITFGTLADKTFGNPDFTVSATASSTLPVTFSASGNCTVSTNTVHLTGAGSCTITASQAGDATYNAATPVQQSFNIAKAATSTAVSSSANPSNSGQNVTFTATVTSTAGTPTGTVQFKDGGTNLGAPQVLSGGVATFSTTGLSAGVHTITAEYSGDVNFLASTGTLSGGQQVGSIIRFSSANYNTTEGSGFTTITVQRIGDLSQAVTVDYATPDDSSAMTIVPCATATGEASPRCDFTTALGTLRFAAGDGAAKTFIVLVNQDSFVEGPETLTLTLSNLTGGAGFTTPGATTSTATLSIADDTIESAGNPIDDTETFVRHHYHDFLNREADSTGLAFWVDNINKCNDPSRRPAGLTVAQCIETFRVHTSAAFYLSIEFQQSGYFVYRISQAGFAEIAPPTVPVPIRYAQFIRDAAEINRGVVVGQGAWEAQLNQNKQAYALAFVQRQEFLLRYPANTSATAFVNSLDQNAGNVLISSERSALISELSPNPADPALRASVLKKVADNAVMVQQHFNRAFVLMQYFGYLRRNPDAAQDTNFSGYNFWLNKLNSFNSDFVKAEMVKAFINSDEYRHRFGP